MHFVCESRLCAERERAEIGDAKISEILANAPSGEDGAWPCEPVRDLLDALSYSEHIGNGFITGRFNQRGVTSRGIYDDGAQERDLPGRTKWMQPELRQDGRSQPGFLGEMARGYEADARWQDTRAEWTGEAEL